jgi:hypothetical protein
MLTKKKTQMTFTTDLLVRWRWLGLMSSNVWARGGGKEFRSSGVRWKGGGVCEKVSIDEESEGYRSKRMANECAARNWVGARPRKLRGNKNKATHHSRYIARHCSYGCPDGLSRLKGTPVEVGILAMTRADTGGKPYYPTTHMNDRSTTTYLRDSFPNPVVYNSGMSFNTSSNSNYKSNMWTEVDRTGMTVSTGQASLQKSRFW